MKAYLNLLKKFKKKVTGKEIKLEKFTEYIFNLKKSNTIFRTRE